MGSSKHKRIFCRIIFSRGSPFNSNPKNRSIHTIVEEEETENGDTNKSSAKKEESPPKRRHIDTMAAEEEEEEDIGKCLSR